MEAFVRTDYQCSCPICGTLMTPFRDLDGHKAYGCVECGRVISNENFFLTRALPDTASRAEEW